MLEPRALEALERIRALHQPTYQLNGIEHTHYVITSTPPADHICVIDGHDHCDPEMDEHAVPACVECRYASADYEYGSPFWPCPTYQATDLDHAADDNADDSPNTKE